MRPEKVKSFIENERQVIILKLFFDLSDFEMKEEKSKEEESKTLKINQSMQRRMEKTSMEKCWKTFHRGNP